MKNTSLFLFSTLCTGATLFAQKAEIKAAQRALDREQWKTAKTDVDKAGTLIAQNRINTSDAVMASYYYTRGQVYLAVADHAPQLISGAQHSNPLNIAAQAFGKLEDFETGQSYQAKDKATHRWAYFDSEAAMKKAMAHGNYSRTRIRKRSKTYSSRAGSTLQRRVSSLSNTAIAAYKAKKFQQAGDDFAALYYLDGVLTGKRDGSYLYYAATAAVQAKDYKNAIRYYQKLLDTGYTGLGKRYTMLNKQMGKRQPVLNEKLAKTLEQTGEFSDLKVEELPDKRPEIYRFEAYSYAQLGDQAQSLALLKKAVARFPKDRDLMSDLVNLYIKQGNVDGYIQILKELITANPNDPELLHDMGIALNRKGDYKEAEKYYRSAIALKPDLATAYLNLAAALLAPEKQLIEKMNKLGNSRSDNAKYKRLQKKRSKLYAEVMPVLEKARKYNPDNLAVLQTLKNIYANQSMDAKYREVKAYIVKLLQKKS